MTDMDSQIQKQFITPESLRIDSFLLAAKVIKDRFYPDFIVAIWRGGAPIGCHVHEFLKYFEINSDHIAIRTSRYCGVDKTSSKIEVHNLGYLIEKLNKTSKVLLIDDVYDSGLSIEAVKDTLKIKLDADYPLDIRTATVYYKPTRNKTGLRPEYYVHDTDRWLVFPHELEGLSVNEIKEHLGMEIGNIITDTVMNRIDKFN